MEIRSGIYRRFFRKKRISGKSRKKIDKEIGNAAVSGMLYIAHIFQKVIDRFNDSPLTEHKSVIIIH